MSGLCRVDFARGQSKGRGNGPKTLITKVPIGIIRKSALCRLCRTRHKRHSFAVGTLLRWYRTGLDPAARLLALSTFLGHVDPASTAVYLTITQDLLQEANRRFEAYARPALEEPAP
jgi:integrase